MRIQNDFVTKFMAFKCCLEMLKFRIVIKHMMAEYLNVGQLAIVQRLIYFQIMKL